MNLKSKILVSTATIALTMTGITGAQATQSETPSRELLEPVSLSERLENTSPPPITVPAGGEVELAYIALPPVTPKPVEITPVQQPTTQAPAAPKPVALPQTQTYSQPAPVAVQEVAVAAAPPTPTTAAPSGVGAALVASAYGQLGVPQDCTAMVENALRSIGKSVGDLAPAQFYSYGSVVSSPQPGDLVITAGHVAIYVGNGKVISGGFDGMNTVEHPLSYLSGASFVRVS